MNFDALALFVTIVEQRSIAAAARGFGISPSLASRRVAALEQEIGARLLIRTTRSLVPTEAGTVLLDWARNAVNDWGRIREDIGARHGKASGVVRLATNDYAASSYIAPILARFAQRQPDVRIAVSIAQEPGRLLDGACDIAVHAGRRPDADLVGRRIYAYQRRLVASPAYLARHPAPQTLADLTQHACLTHALSEPEEWHFEDGTGALLAQRIKPQFSSDGWTMLLQLALAGAGIARLADAIVEKPIIEKQLVEVLPQFRSVSADGDPLAMWVLVAHRRLPMRTRLLADHLAEELISLYRVPRRTSSRAKSARA